MPTVAASEAGEPAIEELHFNLRKDGGVPKGGQLGWVSLLGVLYSQSGEEVGRVVEGLVKGVGGVWKPIGFSKALVGFVPVNRPAIRRDYTRVLVGGVDWSEQGYRIGFGDKVKLVSADQSLVYNSVQLPGLEVEMEIRNTSPGNAVRLVTGEKAPRLAANIMLVEGRGSVKSAGQRESVTLKGYLDWVSLEANPRKTGWDYTTLWGDDGSIFYGVKTRFGTKDGEESCSAAFLKEPGRGIAPFGRFDVKYGKRNGIVGGGERMPTSWGFEAGNEVGKPHVTANLGLDKGRYRDAQHAYGALGLNAAEGLVTGLLSIGGKGGPARGFMEKTWNNRMGF